MPKRERVALIEAPPSTVLLVKHGKRTSEKVILEADGISAMVNEDGTISIEVYTNRESILLRMSPDDTKAQSHIFRKWSQLR